MTLNDSEWKLMRVLWEHGAGGVAEVHAALLAETGWAYSTVKTLLERLVDKGAVGIEPGRAGRRFVPLLAMADARRGALRQLVDRAFDGTFAALVQHMAADGGLSRRERDELIAALAAAGTPATSDGEAGSPAAAEPVTKDRTPQAGDDDA